MNESFQGLTLQQEATLALSSSGKLLSLVLRTAPPDLPWVQEPDFTGSPYPSLPTWESMTQRTRRNSILTYVKSLNRKKELFKALLICL